MLPAHDAPLFEPSREPVVVGRTINVVSDVFFTGPDNLDRSLHLLGDPGSGIGHVGFQPAPKATTEQMIVNVDLRFVETCSLRHGLANPLNGLCPDPYFGARRSDVHCAVQWLHARVRQQWHLILRGYSLAVLALPQRRPDVADILRYRAFAQACSA